MTSSHPPPVILYVVYYCINIIFNKFLLFAAMVTGNDAAVAASG